MEQPPIPQFFGLIPTGHAPILTPTSAPSQTSLVYTIPLDASRPFSHIVVFLLPGIELPSDTAAAVYISLPQSLPQAQAQPPFKFLGGIGPGKESAIFKISPSLLSPSPTSSFTPPTLTIGISIEPASTVASQIASLQSQNAGDGMGGESNALVLANKKPDTLMLAQRIIKNAFNFLASFSGNLEGGVEVVPLKAFEEWWRKFEGRVRNDPGFLERGGD
ncbi:hypothetical protein HYFRA_00004697 [Hymenoscyphus fraxineus]|uniref:Hikeshi-like domain-containing protein n=1 Tax=Hymenoscyphus fraxineus TaxID=746836 RepID=A0A9N9PUR1_9HELO|nr:hypothetical protein HYFRA_00004697 [Hymenoscyphus fraxineus]